jgi:hypothetical protein
VVARSLLHVSRARSILSRHVLTSLGSGNAAAKSMSPFGELCAFCARGLFMGNRGGRFHTDAKMLTRRRWASKQWMSISPSCPSFRQAWPPLPTPGRAAGHQRAGNIPGQGDNIPVLLNDRRGVSWISRTRKRGYVTELNG